ncbi:hypothetical protein [Ktedonobacter sp. SOSP1-52]|nr:hypothetical protein [Ktedonobacter sp. SOSP1-52]
MLTEAPLTNESNDVQAKLAMRQGPAPFFLPSAGVDGSWGSPAGYIGE